MYIIKKHYVATESNVNFKGVIMDYYEDKGETILGCNKRPNGFVVSEYGYKTLASAKRRLNAVKALCESENKGGAWVVSAKPISL